MISNPSHVLWCDACGDELVVSTKSMGDNLYYSLIDEEMVLYGWEEQDDEMYCKDCKK